jgi:hypothetical protein
METIKGYLLVPHHDIPADGPLRLGSIISDQRDPDSLNEGAIVEMSSDSIHISHKYDWVETVESNGGANAGVCARYLGAFFGGSLGGHYNAKSLTHYRLRHLETSFFTPSQEYVEDTINKYKVWTYLEGSRLDPVYMITVSKSDEDQTRR